MDEQKLTEAELRFKVLELALKYQDIFKIKQTVGGSDHAAVINAAEHLARFVFQHPA